MLHCVNLVMVTITKHIFTDICKINYLSAVKFHMGNEKNMRNLLISKSQKVWKKVEKIGPWAFNLSLFYIISTSWFRKGKNNILLTPTEVTY